MVAMNMKGVACCSLHAHMRQMERSHRQRLELRIAQTRATEPFAPWCGAGSAECCLERAAPQMRCFQAFDFVVPLLLPGCSIDALQSIDCMHAAAGLLYNVHQTLH